MGKDDLKSKLNLAQSVDVRSRQVSSSQDSSSTPKDEKKNDATVLGDTDNTEYSTQGSVRRASQVRFTESASKRPATFVCDTGDFLHMGMPLTPAKFGP
jgi:hypothetical protein